MFYCDECGAGDPERHAPGCSRDVAARIDGAARQCAAVREALGLLSRVERGQEWLEACSYHVSVHDLAAHLGLRVVRDNEAG